MKKIILLATLCGIILMSSCSKSATNGPSSSSNPFVGKWTIYSTICGNINFPVVGSPGSSVVITAVSGSTLNLTEYVGNYEVSGNCLKVITMQGTIDSNSFYCPTQTFTDNCGNSFTIYIEGEIDGSDLILNEGTSVSYCTVSCTK